MTRIRKPKRRLKTIRKPNNPVLLQIGEKPAFPTWGAGFSPICKRCKCLVHDGDGAIGEICLLYTSASEAIVKELIAAAKDVETKDQIAATATISAADPEVGEKIAEALDKVGQDGVVTVEDNNRFGLDLDFTEGMRFDKGYIAPYFVTNAEDQTAVLEEPYILLTSGKAVSYTHLAICRNRRPAAGWP